MKRILTECGSYWIIVDDEDYEVLSQFSWAASKERNHIYARRKDSKLTKMHRVIAGTQTIEGETLSSNEVDHANGFALDNRRFNLRVCNSHNQQMANRTGWSRHGYKGVRKYYRRWIAQITVDGANNYLGTFATVEEAAAAYDQAARLAFGEYAKTNGFA